MNNRLSKDFRNGLSQGLSQELRLLQSGTLAGKQHHPEGVLPATVLCCPVADYGKACGKHVPIGTQATAECHPEQHALSYWRCKNDEN